MVGRPTVLLVLSLTALFGCFHEPSTADPEGSTPLGPPLVRDPKGALYEPGAAPRDVELLLGFAPTSTLPSEPSVWLVPGIFSQALAERLALQRAPAFLREQALPLDAEPVSGGLRLRVRSVLEPGRPYTLLWLEPDKSTRFDLRASASPWLGAALAETFPGHGEQRAPTNLARALLRFDGYLDGEIADHVRLTRGELELPVEVTQMRCEELALPPGDCVWLAPRAPLADLQEHAIAVSAGPFSATGAPLPPAEIHFVTGGRDISAPKLTPTACASDEQKRGAVCLLLGAQAFSVRGQVDEPALLSLRMPTHAAATLSYANQFALMDLPLAAASHVALRATDLAGNVVEESFEVQPLLELAALVIDEVRSDPLGREPVQEYIELLNSGDQVISLEGFTITDDMLGRGRTVTSATSLAPAERTLLVAPDFDPHDQADGSLPSAVRLTHLDGSLSLANGGGALFLRDKLGRRVATARFGATQFPGQCSFRSLIDIPSQRGKLLLDPDGGCTPGAATLPAP